MYAIIATGGKQYKVSKGDKVRIEKIEAQVGGAVTFDQVLMISAGEVTVGSPCVEGAQVEAEVTAQGKDKKVIVYKYKPKTGYHKKNGHRQLFTEVEIKKVIFGGEELEDEAAEEPVVNVTEEKTEEPVAAAAEETAEESAVEEVAEEVAKEAAEDAEEAVEEATADAE